jgi:4-aminobutyrate aminotransferase-like enzyme
MRDEGILAGTDGPFHNVVKVRPPMPFDEANADRLVETFDRAIAELVPRSDPASGAAPLGQGLHWM